MSILEEVGCVVATLSASFKLQDVSAGPYAAFSTTEFRAKMQSAVPEYLGVACNLFNLDLKRWAVDTESLSRVELEDYAAKHFSTEQALARDGVAFRLARPVGVAVFSTDNPGPPGSWRKISLDKQVYAFLLAWAKWEKTPATDPARQAMLAKFRLAARHCPMDFYYFEVLPDVEKQVFRATVQLMESIRSKEEEFGTGGWQMCCLLQKARLLQRASGQGESPEAVDALLAGVDFAKTSDYQVGRKTTADALKVYDRITACSLQDLLAVARLKFPKSVLDMTSKLIVISQKARGFSHKE